jgi:hypothetical protein
VEAQILKYVWFSETFNVPIFCGEFGVYKDCLDKDLGGLDWITDVLELFTKYRINYTYHCYNDPPMGIYRSPNGLDPPSDKTADKKLIRVLEKALHMKNEN